MKLSLVHLPSLRPGSVRAAQLMTLAEPLSAVICFFLSVNETLSCHRFQLRPPLRCRQQVESEQQVPQDVTKGS